MRDKLRLLFITINLCCPFFVFSQNSNFHFNAGFLLSQVDGDNYGGFNKMGYSIGGGFLLNQKDKRYLDWNTRLNQKGYREVNETTYDRLPLNYLEMELCQQFKIANKTFLGGGLYGAYLLNNWRTVRKTDYAWLARLDYHVSNNFSLQTRFSWSLRSIREIQYIVWYNRAISLEAVYLF